MKTYMTDKIIKTKYKVHSYAWGIRDGVSLFFNRPLHNRIEAELLILDNHLGEEKFFESIKFNVKILAIAKNLSIQVHPKNNNRSQKRKDEYVYALDNMSLFLGVKSDNEILSMHDSVDGDEFGEFKNLISLYISHGIEHIALNSKYLNLEKISTQFLELLYSGKYQIYSNSRSELYYHELIKILEKYNQDNGILILPFLRYLELATGQCVYVPSGMIHCYLSGVGVEVSEASEDTIRYGLTEKTVDVDLFVSNIDNSFSGSNFIEQKKEKLGESYDLKIAQLNTLRLVDKNAVKIIAETTSVLLCKKGVLKIQNGNEVVELEAGESVLFVGYVDVCAVKASSVILIGDFTL